MHDETSTKLVIPQNESVDLKSLFARQRTYIDNFFENLDLTHVEPFFQELLNCQGVVIVTGVGKSGIIAQKIATTLVSTGTRAIYLSPTDALHGDLGIVSSRDIVVFLSKSGESDELLGLIPAIRNKGARLLSMVSNPESRLARAADRVVNLPLTQELCPFDLAPTTSDVLQLIFGDVLAVALMKAKGFSIDQYAKNHPAGRIGKRITLRVDDLMLKGDALPVCRSNRTLGSLLVLLSDKQCGCLLVTDENERLLGIFTDGDLRRSLQKEPESFLTRIVGDLMSPSPRTIAPTALAYDALKVMEGDQQRPITVLPVTQNGRCLGLIKLHDLLQSGV
jgi:arabinose-5-phosphate isomerase